MYNIKQFLIEYYELNIANEHIIDLNFDLSTNIYNLKIEYDLKKLNDSMKIINKIKQDFLNSSNKNDVFKSWLEFNKNINVIKLSKFKNSYQIAKSTVDTDFIKQFSKLYAYKFTFKGIENGNVLLYHKDEKITNDILIKSICEQLPEYLFMKYKKLNLNPTKYIVLNSWFGLDGPYTYDFLIVFRKKFNEYMEYDGLFEDYPEYEKYINEKIYANYIKTLNSDLLDQAIEFDIYTDKLLVKCENSFDLEWYEFLNWAYINDKSLIEILQFV